MTDTWETSITTETWESNDTPGVVWTTVVSDGSGGGGVTVHNSLTGRDATDSHPMGAVTGLTSALGDKADSSSLAAVATSGDYSDLTGRPSLGSAAAADTTDFAPAVHSHDITSLTTTAADGKMPVTASGGITLVDVPSGGGVLQAPFVPDGGWGVNDWFAPPGVSLGTLAIATFTKDVNWWLPFPVFQPIRITAAAIRIATARAGSSIRGGIVSLDDTQQPISLVTEFPLWDTSGTGILAKTGLNVVLQPGIYSTVIKAEGDNPSIVYAPVTSTYLPGGVRLDGGGYGTAATVTTRSTTAGAFADPPQDHRGVFVGLAVQYSFVFLRWEAA